MWHSVWKKFDHLGLKEIFPNLSDQMEQKLIMEQETGVSNWVRALLIKEKGSSLNKKEFTGSLAMRSGLIVKGLLEVYACGESFDECHAMTLSKWRFYIHPAWWDKRHNQFSAERGLQWCNHRTTAVAVGRGEFDFKKLKKNRKQG